MTRLGTLTAQNRAKRLCARMRAGMTGWREDKLSCNGGRRALGEGGT